MTTLLCVLVSSLPAQPALAVDTVAAETVQPVLELATVTAEPASALNAALAPVPLAPAAVAPEDYPDMEYTYVEASYVWTDSDLVGDTLDGWELTGSFELPLNFFLQGTVRDQSSDSDLSTYRIGAGWHLGFTSRFDAYGIVSFVHLEGDTGTDDFTDEGAGAEVGLRFLLTRGIELNGRLLWADVGDNDGGAGLGARYYFNSFLSLSARVDVIGNDEIAAAGLRFEL